MSSSCRPAPVRSSPGFIRASRELERVGAIDDVPKIVAAQAAGCAPIAAAIERDLDEPEPWSTPDTICGELEIADPAGGAAAVEAVRESGGTAGRASRTMTFSRARSRSRKTR